MELVCYRTAGDFALAFYLQQTSIPSYWEKEEIRNRLNGKKDLLIYTGADGVEALKADSIPFTVIEERYKFSITKLNLEFLNPKTRSGVCEKVFLLRVPASYSSPKYSLR